MEPQTLKYLIDSNILIYHLNGEQIATRFIKKHFEDSAISWITYIEVLSFDLSVDQEQAVIKFLKLFDMLAVDREISHQAVENRKHKKIKIPDNIIVSTAQVHNLILVTRNVSDFNGIDVKIHNIF
jgi:predicted nucleic acid-binding protein